MSGVDDILSFWLEEVGPSGWYNSDDALDARIRDKFLDEWQAAKRLERCDWLTKPRSALAFVILTDQFPRNMFRGSAESFATDKLALQAAKKLIHAGFDMKVAEPERQFFYLPLMHSECLTDQDRCVRLMLTRMPDSGAHNLLHAKVHREIIRKFGRFPYRNKALARADSECESDFLQNGGYGRTLEELRA